MLQCRIACDVTFSVGPTQDTVEDIAAHKYMLVSRSPVFFAMFCGPMSETTSSGTIRVPDVEPDAFRHMLEYLYSDEVELSDDLVLPILYIGKKYIIPALTTKCTTYLEEHLHPDNVCLIYEQSLLYDETTLIEKCVLFIETRTEDVLHSSSFTDIPLALLTRILQFECLTISELELFQACLRWAQSECKRHNKDTCPRNKRKILGDAIYLIHFPSMSLKEFSRVVARSGILTAEEKCSVFEYLTCEEDCDSHALLFPVTPRQKPQPSILKRFSVFGKSNVYSGDCSIMKLQCDKPVIIKGFGVSASLNYDPLAEIQVTIKQDRTFMCNRSIPITEERSVDIMHVCLPECVIFKANTWYTIIVTFHFYGDHDQGSCRRGKGGSKTITFDGVTFEFDRADSAGFVPQILFCSA
ncbi:hypothetical protein NP493_19g13007 [Ridgeia piscesae]|uniref:BTB domain-containing protein n=1 Tax=Ridgeia piscesae TaxID=27915 RepID=A0AAD9PE32_RIDPI|nr:hypothetical protein NP493_19g13007 [Ridgeia piscesae]